MHVGLPFSSPIVHMVTPLSNGSIFVNWTISNPDYNHTVIWTNLNTSVMSNYTVPRNTNSYIITALIVNAYYNVSVAAIGVCGMMTSDPITTKSCECVCTYVTSLTCMYTCVDWLRIKCTFKNFKGSYYESITATNSKET